MNCLLGINVLSVSLLLCVSALKTDLLELQYQAIQRGYIGLRPGQAELDTGINIQMVINLIAQTGQGIDRQFV